MKKKLLVACLIVVISVCTISCASSHQEAFPQDQPTVREISALETRISNAVNDSENLLVETIGEVTYFETGFPIWMVSYNPDPREALYKVLICAGIHGNEPASVEIALRIIEDLTEDTGQHTNISFDIIPVINPWGWSRDLRFNRDGIDINRDFASFESREAEIIRDFTAAKEYDLILDYHEDPGAKGFYLYQYANPDSDLSRSVIKAVHELGYPIEQDVNMIILKTDDGLIDAPLWGLWYMKFSGQLSMSNYFRLNNSEHVYTVETPTVLPWEDRLAMHRTAFDILLSGLE